MARRLVRVQQKGQVTLPAAVRRKLNLKRGDMVAVEDTDGRVLITPQSAVLAAPLAWHEFPLTDPLKEGITMKGNDSLAIPMPTAEELARRAAVIDQILAARSQRPSIAPLTTADLVRLAREEEGGTDGPGA